MVGLFHIFTFVLLTFSLIANATSITSASDNVFDKNAYYEISHQNSNSIPTIDLLLWNKIEEMPPKPIAKYDRKSHFGTWLQRLTTDGCHESVRHTVLKRDSIDEVITSPTNVCKVISGKWDDPYAPNIYNDPFKIEIDHVVPLKNAYNLGASTWDNNKRCAYFNFLGNSFHLLPVSHTENNAKLDKPIDQWMPTKKEAFSCLYLSYWVKIKYIWNLKIGLDEGNAIKDYIQKYQCDSNDFTITQEFADDQLVKIQNGIEECNRFQAQNESRKPSL